MRAIPVLAARVAAWNASRDRFGVIVPTRQTSDRRPGGARDLTARHWLAVALALALGTINVAVGWATGQSPFYVVGLTFFAGVALFVSPYWEPVLYLVAAVHVGALGVVWAAGGARFFELGVLTGLLSAGFFVAVLSLFVRESRDSPRRR